MQECYKALVGKKCSLFFISVSYDDVEVGVKTFVPDGGINRIQDQAACVRIGDGAVAGAGITDQDIALLMKAVAI